jgi:NitT/TauT family transport system substrate-binding protein
MSPAIKTAADLKGKAVATNLSYNTDWTMMREWLRKQNVDLKTVTFREIPFPDMLAAIRNNTVEAAGVTEPFVTLGKEQGARVLGYYFTDVKSPNVLSGIVAMLPYVEKNKEVVRRFLNAINRAIDDFKDPKIVRETIAANTKIPPTVIEKMNLGEWSKNVPPETMQFWVDSAKKEGIVNATADLSSLVWQDK